LWHFADNDEDIKIPENWKMYFTANIGAKHGVFPTPEAFASSLVSESAKWEKLIREKNIQPD
jgi:hypothetical protein